MAKRFGGLTKLSTKALPNSNQFNQSQPGVGGAAGNAVVQADVLAEALRVAQGILGSSGVPQSVSGMAPPRSPRATRNSMAVPNPPNPATQTLHDKPGRSSAPQDPNTKLP